MEPFDPPPIPSGLVPVAPIEVPRPTWGDLGAENHLVKLLSPAWLAAVHQAPVVVAGGALRWALETELGIEAGGETPQALRDVDLFVEDRDVATRIAAFVDDRHDLEMPGRYKWTKPLPGQPIMDLVWGPGGRSRADLWLRKRPTLRAFAEDLIATFDLSAAQAAMWWDPERSRWDFAFGEHFDADVRARRLRLVGKIEDTNVHRLFRFFERGYKPEPKEGGGS